MTDPHTGLRPTFRELSFQLFDVLTLEQCSQRSRYGHHDRATLTAILESLVRLSMPGESSSNPAAALASENAGVVPEPLMALANGLLISASPERQPLFRTAEALPEHALAVFLGERSRWRSWLSETLASGQAEGAAAAGVRESLLAIKCREEAGLALGLFVASLAEDQRTHPEAVSQQQAGYLFELLEPVLRWLMTPPAGHAGARPDLAAGEQVKLAREFLGRRIWARQSQGLQHWLQLLQKDLEAAVTADCQQWALSLSETLQRAVRVTQQLGQALQDEDPDQVLANGTRYLHLFGVMAQAWMWLRQANAAARLLVVSAPDEQGYYRGKLQAARYFFHWQLPSVAQDLVLLQNRDNTCLEMRPEWF